MTIQKQRSFNPIKPIYFMHTSDITRQEKKIALETLKEILQIAGVEGKIPIIDNGFWRSPDYKDPQGKLNPHMSVDWYVNNWLNEYRKQINVDYSARELMNDSWNKTEPHYDIILTAQDLYAPKTNFIVGFACPERGAVVSVNRFRNLYDKRMERESKKQELYHEIGHVFNLPNEARADLEDSLGAHCKNICAMRQGLNVPYDWINFVKDRDKTRQIYCDTCTKDLRKFFLN